MYGWDDAGWHCGKKVWTFNTREQAQMEINEFVSISNEEGGCNEECEDHDVNDYRIVEV